MFVAQEFVCVDVSFEKIAVDTKKENEMIFSKSKQINNKDSRVLIALLSKSFFIIFNDFFFLVIFYRWLKLLYASPIVNKKYLFISLSKFEFHLWTLFRDQTLTASSMTNEFPSVMHNKSLFMNGHCKEESYPCVEMFGFLCLMLESTKDHLTVMFCAWYTLLKLYLII